MADMALFIGWGAPVRGREEKGLDVFNEAISYYGGLQGDGRIESFEVALLEPHGGDLYGFIVLRGSRDQLDGIRGEDEFARITTRAGLVVESLGVVPAHIGEGVANQVTRYREQIGDLV